MNELERVDLPPEVAEAVLRLLDEPDPLAALPAAGEGCGEMRDLLEAWATLPIALEQRTPSAATRERLLSRVAALSAESASAMRWDEATPMPEPWRESRDDRQAFERRRPTLWLLPLAATLVAALGVSAWLWSRVEEQNQRIAGLTRQVAELGEARFGPTEEARLAALEEYLRIVSTPGVEVCPLRLTAVQAGAGQASGMLYVAPDHQHWYLALSGLRPAPEGQAYHLWFFVDDRPVSAGAFAARQGEVVRLGSDAMPEGTHAVGITLEPSEDVEQPSSEPILFGDEVMRVA